MKYIHFLILAVSICSCKSDPVEKPLTLTTYHGTRHHVYKEHNCDSTSADEPWECLKWKTTITTDQTDTNSILLTDNNNGTYSIHDNFDEYANHTFSFDNNKYYKGYDITIPQEAAGSGNSTYIVRFSKPDADTLFIDINETYSGSMSGADKTLEYILILD